MTLKQKALIQTVAIILSMIFGSVALQVMLYNVPAEILGYLFLALFTGFLVKLIYDLVLSRLESAETLQNLNKTL